MSMCYERTIFCECMVWSDEIPSRMYNIWNIFKNSRGIFCTWKTWSFSRDHPDEVSVGYLDKEVMLKVFKYRGTSLDIKDLLNYLFDIEHSLEIF